MGVGVQILKRQFFQPLKSFLSDILNDTMKSVYDKEGILVGEQGDEWTAFSEHINRIDEIIGKLEETDDSGNSRAQRDKHNVAGFRGQCC